VEPVNPEDSSPALTPVHAEVRLSAARRAALSLSLPGHINALQQGRGVDVPQDVLGDYIELGWMRWAGGHLVITYQGVAARERSLRETGDDE